MLFGIPSIGFSVDLRGDALSGISPFLDHFGLQGWNPAEHSSVVIDVAVDYTNHCAAECRAMGSLDGILCSASRNTGTIYVRDGSVAWSALYPDRLRVGLFSARAVRVPTCLEAALAHALAMQGNLVVHGLAAQIDDFRFLALGISRSGKSTLAAAVLNAGGKVVSDDLVILARGGDGGPIVRWLRPFLSFRATTVPHLKDLMRRNLVRLSTQALTEERWELHREDSPDSFLEEIRPSHLLALNFAPSRRHLAVEPISQSLAYAKLLQAATPVHFSRMHADVFGRAMAQGRSAVMQLELASLTTGTRLMTHPEEELARLRELGGNVPHARFPE